MKSKAIIFLCLAFLTTNLVAGGTGRLTIVSHWVGPSGYDRVQVNENVSDIGGGCTMNNWFAIKSDNPEYKAMHSVVLAALMARKKISVFGPGTSADCISGKYAVVTRVTVYP